MNKFFTLLFCIPIMFVLSVTVISKVILPMFGTATQNYMDAHGVTTIAEGKVSNKQYIAAHTDNERSLLFSSSTFYPEKYEIQISRYDTSKSKYETATYDIDKATFDKLNVGDHYKDALGRTAFFQFDSE